jgi:hypothetical protein
MQAGFDAHVVPIKLDMHMPWEWWAFINAGAATTGPSRHISACVCVCLVLPCLQAFTFVA